MVSSKWVTFASDGFGCQIHVNQPPQRKLLQKVIFAKPVGVIEYEIFELDSPFV